MISLAVLASGSGSNAERLYTYFENHPEIRVACFLTNNPKAGVIERGHRLGVPTVVFNRKMFTGSDTVSRILAQFEIDWVILGGFLWLIPASLITQFPNKIINIHPALLPKYGGKGMYGDRVHHAIIDAKEEESGITIHFVDENFDEGEIIHQSRFRIEPGDDLEMIKFKGQQLEHLHYPKVVEHLLKKMKS
jgi:phosphoribosylglycinamide formyltransferase-1